MADDESRLDLGARVRHLSSFAHIVRAAIVILTLSAWGLAYHLWTIGHAPSALVLLIMGYLLIRSLRKITFNLTWQRFGRRSGYRSLLLALDEDVILSGEAALLVQLQRSQREQIDREDKPSDV